MRECARQSLRATSSRVRLLVRSGAAVNNDEGHSNALITCCKKGLYDGSQVGMRAISHRVGRGGRPPGPCITPLLQSVASGSAELVRLLLDSRADPDRLTFFDEVGGSPSISPVTVAVSKGEIKCRRCSSQRASAVSQWRPVFARTVQRQEGSGEAGRGARSNVRSRSSRR